MAATDRGALGGRPLAPAAVANVGDTKSAAIRKETTIGTKAWRLAVTRRRITPLDPRPRVSRTAQPPIIRPWQLQRESNPAPRPRRSDPIGDDRSAMSLAAHEGRSQHAMEDVLIERASLQVRTKATTARVQFGPTMTVAGLLRTTPGRWPSSMWLMPRRGSPRVPGAAPSQSPCWLDWASIDDTKGWASALASCVMSSLGGCSSERRSDAGAC